MESLEVFTAPPKLGKDLIKFYNNQKSTNLNNLDNCDVLKKHIGVYILFYHGNFETYEILKKINRNEDILPIYVGKAVPAGRRIGFASGDQTLYKRLREHSRSINDSDLESSDFSFKVVAMDYDLVSWGESLLIGHFQPVWNTIINGFGIHDPGSGRYNQERSNWDQLHPGRSFSKKLNVHTPIDPKNIKTLVDKHCSQQMKRLFEK